MRERTAPAHSLGMRAARFNILVAGQGFDATVNGYA